MRALGLAVVAGALSSATAFAACPDDCDDDGWTVVDGDCDDEDATANPGEEESCDAPADEDCDGFFDDGCDRALQRATLQGGSTCGTAPGGLLAALVALLVARRSRC